MTGSSRSPFLKEYGFWDYTTPLAGGMEMFRRDDYLLLLDDMAGAGMNSLAVNIKWCTTGYRSRLDFLDQLPGNPVLTGLSLPRGRNRGQKKRPRWKEERSTRDQGSATVSSVVNRLS